MPVISRIVSPARGPAPSQHTLLWLPEDKNGGAEERKLEERKRERESANVRHDPNKNSMRQGHG